DEAQQALGLVPAQVGGDVDGGVHACMPPFDSAPAALRSGRTELRIVRPGRTRFSSVRAERRCEAPESKHAPRPGRTKFGIAGHGRMRSAAVRAERRRAAPESKHAEPRIRNTPPASSSDRKSVV